MKPLLQRAVVVVGSPRPQGTSTSGMLADELNQRLEALSVASTTWPVTRIYRETTTFDAFLEDLERAELWVLCFPVYVDSLPYPLTALLENVHDRLPRRVPPLRLMAIANCGFPESDHTRVALGICETFARQTGLAWLGGLGLAGGESLHGRRLESRGALADNAREALDLAAAAVARGEPVPSEAARLMGEPLMPPPLYRWAGAAGWLFQAVQNRSLLKLWSTPFAPGRRDR